LLTVFALGAGMHRYFSHRAFKTSRAFQLFMALLAGAFFGDAVSFAGRHRIHHCHSDTEADVHSPREGMWHCWLGHVLKHRYDESDVLAMVPDLTRYPELMWLHRFWIVPGALVASGAWLLGGYPLFAAGFCLSCLTALHVTSAVNYFGHRGRRRPFDVGDDSSNSILLAILFLGEGWHNNHHRFPSAARAGLRWWEVDVLYYVLKLLSWTGLIWDLREPRLPVAEPRSAPA